MDGMRAFCELVFYHDRDRQAKVVKALNQLSVFKSKDGLFKLPVCQAAAAASLPFAPLGDVDQVTYSSWWLAWGYKTPELQAVALRALSQAVSIGAAEREHKTHKFLQNKVRNRMSSSTAEKLVVVHSALGVQQAVLRGEEGEGDGVEEVRARLHAWLKEEEEELGAEATSPAGKSAPADGMSVFAAYLEPWESEILRKNDNAAKLSFEKKYKGMYLRELIVDADGEDEAEYDERVVIDIVRAKVGPRGASEWHVQTNLLVERTMEDGSVVNEQAPIPPPDAANRARAVVDCRALYRIGAELHALLADSKLNKDFFFRTSPDQ